MPSGGSGGWPSARTLRQWAIPDQLSEQHRQPDCARQRVDWRLGPEPLLRDVSAASISSEQIGVSDITVTATNGDSVVLEKVSDGRRKQEIIWELVAG